MKTSSCKAKGRILQQKIVSMLLELFKGKLTKDDVKSTSMGVSGVDVPLSTRAKELIPFDIEAKCQEKLNIWGAIKQCETNTEEGRIPLVVFKRNRSEIYCTLKFEDLLKLQRPLKVEFKSNDLKDRVDGIVNIAFINLRDRLKEVF